MVPIVSILNLTRYETQVNRQWINIILKELTKSNEDIRALFNITNQLATQVQVQNIMLHLQAMLTNLRDCLHFMKQLANHILEYIDTATTGTLTPRFYTHYNLCGDHIDCYDWQLDVVLWIHGDHMTECIYNWNVCSLFVHNFERQIWKGSMSLCTLGLMSMICFL